MAMISSVGADARNGKIHILSACSVMILAIGLMNHVMVIPPLLRAAERDAWLSVLVSLLPYLVWTGGLYCIMARTGQQPILPWLRQHYGVLASGGFRALFLIYLFLIGVITVKETSMWTHSSYLPRTPLVVVSSTLILVCAWGAYAGIRSIAITSGFLLPWVVIFGDFVMSANLPKKNYTLLRPLLEHGPVPMLMGCMYVGGGLAELLVFLLIQHRLQSKMRLWGMWGLAVFLVLLVFGPVTGAIAEFGPFEARELRHPAFEEWRLVSIGRYIRHLDFLSIYQWHSGSFARISLSLFLLLDLLAPERKKKIRIFWLVVITVSMLALVQLPFSDMQYLYFLRTIYLPGSLLVSTAMLAALLMLVLISAIRKPKGESS
jgi:spore germination protein (amino acid permease)